ncbi:ABC transporter permease [Streptomyces mirabilis]|uniref:ABC transporter permease n=1 Tax=Streptomyces mirabilis TaxID=68239 RepID=UPI003678F89F
MTGKIRAAALHLWLPIVLIASWYWWSAGSKSLYFPPLGDIISTLRQDWFFARFGSDAVPSLVNFFAGYLLACVLGVGLGLVMGRLHLLSDALHPLVELVRSLPGVALVPVALLLLGANDEMRISLIAFGSVWVVLLNTADAIRGVDPLLDDVSGAFHLSRWHRLSRVVIPAASPQIFAGLRIALSIALVVMIVSEFMATSRGIGFAILQDQRAYLITEMWAAMVFLGVLGYLLNVLFSAVEHRLLHWHRATSAGRQVEL